MAAVAGTVPEGTTEIWKDKKRYLWLWGLMVPGFGIAFAVAYVATGGWWGFTLVAPFLINFFIPLLDLVFGLDNSNPPDDVIEALENDKYYRWVVYAYIPLMFFILFAGFAIIDGVNPVAWIVTLVGAAAGARQPRRQPDAAHLDMPWWREGAVGLLDRRCRRASASTPPTSWATRRSRRALARQDHPRADLLRPLLHRAQPRPPRPRRDARGPRVLADRARTSGPVLAAHGLGLAEVVVGGRGQALQAQGHAPVPRRQRRPQRLGDVGGPLRRDHRGLRLGRRDPYIPITVVFGFSLLEIINYLEHYGMKRQLVGPPERQRYERVLPEHSWNSNNIVTNIFLYHLQRHSDHHANPTRRYQALRDFKESPALPTGYAGMLTIALVPAAVAQGDGPPRARAPRR
jgi:alkane 1-monooxygenase